jgi:MOSC domain-containing protein YiiM
MRFDRDDIVGRFLESGRPGFYLAVEKEGELAPGDPFERIHEDEHRVAVVDIVRLYLERHGKPDFDLLRRAVEVEALPESWRGIFRKRLG